MAYVLVLLRTIIDVFSIELLINGNYNKIILVKTINTTPMVHFW